MINTSMEYKKAIHGNREFCVMDEITFSDGTKMPLDMGDFTTYSINEATSSAGKFEIGAAVIKEYSATLNNMDGKFDECDFEGADILAKVGLKLEDGTWEILQKGTYRVVKAKASELTIQVTAYDSMLFFDRPYSNCALSYPTTLSLIIQQACLDCGMAYDASTIEMGDYVVQSRPDDGALTYRDIISYCAQIMGCYARINHMDRLSFGWYAFDALPDGLDGGNFEGTATPYETGDDADGGNFDDYSSGYAYDSGTFQDAENYHHFYNLSSQTINTDDITITGIAVSGGTEGDNAESYLYGTDEYALELSDNPLIQAGKVQQVAEHVGSKLAGSTFRPLSITVQSDPCVEAGDAAIVTDRKQRSYRTVITNTTFAIGSIQKVECTAETPTEKNYAKYGATTKLLAKADKQTGEKLSAYDIAVKQMNQLAANTMGFYSTVITQPDGSVLAYRHDKPELAESKTVYKSGIDGFFVTQDYQGTDEATTAAGKWDSGFDANGNAVLNILSAIGINADWINAGTLKITKNGKTVFYADVDTGKVDIVADSFALSSGETIESIAEAAANDAVEGQTQTDIFNKLTNNGILKGLYMQNGELYINASYLKTGYLSADRIQGGELILGGAGNGNGKLVIKNASGVQIGYIDNTGVHFNAGSFSGTLDAATGSFSGDITATGGSIGGLKITANGFSQEVDVSDSKKTGSYTITINKKGIVFDVNYKYLDGTVILEDSVYTKINEESIYTKYLYADTLKLVPGALKTGGSAARAIGISSSGNIVIMP